MDLESSTVNASTTTSAFLKSSNSPGPSKKKTSILSILVTICIFVAHAAMPWFSPPNVHLLKFRHRETPAKTCRCPVDAEALDPVTAKASIIGVPADLGRPDVVGNIFGTMKTPAKDGGVFTLPCMGRKWCRVCRVGDDWSAECNQVRVWKWHILTEKKGWCWIVLTIVLAACLAWTGLKGTQWLRSLDLNELQAV